MLIQEDVVFRSSTCVRMCVYTLSHLSGLYTYIYIYAYIYIYTHTHTCAFISLLTGSPGIVLVTGLPHQNRWPRRGEHSTTLEARFRSSKLTCKQEIGYFS